ncbi:MAG: hypothetical protein OEU92_01865 [Alphaproteobacteria bacterium]|nr:hypothetical protein [Alphaproteobacteria bacterium]
MLETKKDHRKQTLTLFLPTVTLLVVLPLAEPAFADSHSLMNYGQDLCADAGIAADDCTLLPAGPGPAGTVPSVDAEAAAATKGAKSATLIEHAAWVCIKEGVPLEDCKALPTAYRAPQQDASPSPFLTVAPTPPGPSAAPVPAPAPAPAYAEPVAVSTHQARPHRPPAPVTRQEMRYGQPAPAAGARQPIPVVQQSARYASAPAPGYGGAPPLYDEAFPAPYRHQPPPEIRQETRYIPQPPPIDPRIAPAFGDVPPVRYLGRPAHPFAEPAGRCRRGVRYSGPRSYRYIACQR